MLAPVRYLTSRKCADASEVTVTETDHTQNKDTRFVFAELPLIAAPKLLLILPQIHNVSLIARYRSIQTIPICGVNGPIELAAPHLHT